MRGTKTFRQAYFERSSFMKSRTFIHLFFLLLILIIAAIAHFAVYRAALIRGYEPSMAYAVRNLILLGVLFIMPLLMSRIFRFAGDWTIYTVAVLLFALGSVVQYRLASDPEYTKNTAARNAAKELKVETLQLRYIKEHYSLEKKKFAGMDATPPKPANLDEEKHRQSTYTMANALIDRETGIPIFAFLGCVLFFYLFTKDALLNRIQRNGFLVALLTLIPLIGALVLAFAIGAIKNGKITGGLTPWELSKIPFLLGFAAILSVLYQNLARTYWGFPRAQDVIPIVFMMILPFVPFFLLQDFGQMLVFVGVYITVFLLAIRKFPQRFVFVGTILFVTTLIIVAALPTQIQQKVPTLATVAQPISDRFPSRIKQRFYLWFDLFTPPAPDTEWWKKDLVDYYTANYQEYLLTKNEESELVKFYSDESESFIRENAAKTAALIEKNRQVNEKYKVPNLSVAENEVLRKEIKKTIAEIRPFAETDLMAMYELSQAKPEDIKDRFDERTETQPGEQTEDNEDDKSTPAELKAEKRKLEAATKAIEQARAKIEGINEDAWFNDDALQATMASFGLSSGGKTGRGLGLGYVEMIPEAGTDYVFAALGEELGVAGGLLVILALIIFVNSGARIALDARDTFSKLAAAGLTAFIGYQALVNIGGITRALPMTGITLPFISHGGFSLLTSFAMLGMLLAISHRSGLDARNAKVAPKETVSEK